jgi:maltooligosyltrehalose trehalohydrolase
MRRESFGYHAIEFSADEFPIGKRYAFSLDKGPNRPDPASRFQPDGVSAPSATLDPQSFAWSDSG